MTFSLFLFIFTCFAMSFALRSDATARLILDASVLHCTRASPRSPLLVAGLSLSAECRSVSSFLLCLFPCTIFLLNAAVFADLAWYLAVGGSASVESFTLLQISCFKHVWHRFLGCLSVGAVHALFLSSSRLAICTTKPGDCASVCSRSAFTAPGDCAAVCWRWGFNKIWTLLRVIVWVICASHGTCGATPQRFSVQPLTSS